MAVPCGFDESNAVLGRPEGMTDEQCDPLSVAHVITGDGQPAVVSCFKLTKEELAEINRTGRVWLWVWGETMPPVAVDGRKPAFGAPPGPDAGG